MSTDLSTDDLSIKSVSELAHGDAIYSEATHTSYWVVSITRQKIVLEKQDGRKHRWRRDTFEEALEAHTWIHQA